jgi:hypothetical protein
LLEEGDQLIPALGLDQIALEEKRAASKRRQRPRTVVKIAGDTQRLTIARICVSSSVEARLADSSSSMLDRACPFVGGESTIVAGGASSPYGFCGACSVFGAALSAARTGTMSSVFGGEPDPFVRERRRMIFLLAEGPGKGAESRPGYHRWEKRVSAIGSACRQKRLLPDAQRGSSHRPAAKSSLGSAMRPRDTDGSRSVNDCARLPQSQSGTGRTMVRVSPLAIESPASERSDERSDDDATEPLSESSSDSDPSDVRGEPDRLLATNVRAKPLAPDALATLTGRGRPSALLQKSTMIDCSGTRYRLFDRTTSS